MIQKEKKNYLDLNRDITKNKTEGRWKRSSGKVVEKEAPVLEIILSHESVCCQKPGMRLKTSIPLLKKSEPTLWDPIHHRLMVIIRKIKRIEWRRSHLVWRELEIQPISKKGRDWGVGRWAAAGSGMRGKGWGAGFWKVKTLGDESAEAFLLSNSRLALTRRSL